MTHSNDSATRQARVAAATPPTRAEAAGRGRRAVTRRCDPDSRFELETSAARGGRGGRGLGSAKQHKQRGGSDPSTILRSSRTGGRMPAKPVVVFDSKELTDRDRFAGTVVMRCTATLEGECPRSRSGRRVPPAPKAAPAAAARGPEPGPRRRVRIGQSNEQAAAEPKSASESQRGPAARAARERRAVTP